MSELTEIGASKEIEGVKKTASIAYDFGENCAEAIEKFGDNVVFTNFKAAAKITAQGIMRRGLETGLDADAIVAKMNEWKPGVAMERIVDPAGALLGRWDSYSPEERMEILEKLKTKSETLG